MQKPYYFKILQRNAKSFEDLPTKEAVAVEEWCVPVASGPVAS